MRSPSLQEAPALSDDATVSSDSRVDQVRGRLAKSETTKAAGLAIAAMVGNLVAVGSTVVFSRILGTGGYGAVATLLNFGIILQVPGSALQVVAAREGTLGHLGSGAELAATLSRWTRHILICLALMIVILIPLRGALAAMLNVHQVWGALAVPVTGVLWMLVSVQRGLLQAQPAYRAVGISVVLEASGRLLVGLAFVLMGLGVTGAYLGTTLSLVITAVILNFVLHRRLGPAGKDKPPHPLRSLLRTAAFPIGALVLVASLQNIDVIMAKHAFSEKNAGIYAAVAVASKALVFIAIGVGFWVLPEVTRRAAKGRDPRLVLGLALGLIGLLGAIALLIFGSVPDLLIRLAFGKEYLGGAKILLTLGFAYAALSGTYLVVQFFLGLHRKFFLLILAAVAIAEPILLLQKTSLINFSHMVLIVEAAGAIALLLLALRTRTSARKVISPQEPALATEAGLPFHIDE